MASELRSISSFLASEALLCERCLLDQFKAASCRKVEAAAELIKVHACSGHLEFLGGGRQQICNIEHLESDGSVERESVHITEQTTIPQFLP